MSYKGSCELNHSRSRSHFEDLWKQWQKKKKISKEPSKSVYSVHSTYPINQNKHSDVFLFFFYLSNKNMHQQTLWTYFHPASSLSVTGETPLHIYRGTCGQQAAPSGRQHWHLDHRPMTNATSLIETRAPLHAVFPPQQEKPLSDRI